MCEVTRREFALGGSALGLSLLLGRAAVAQAGKVAVTDTLSFLPAREVRFEGYFADTLTNSLQHWNMGVLPYKALADMFRNGRKLFATGEMWGKGVRSGAMFYRYTGDPKLKAMLAETVADLISTRRSNGSISASAVEAQPDSKMGDLWERTYVLLALEGYYEDVERDPAVLKAMVEELDCTIAQIGPAPKVPITETGWSLNKIESSTILEPVLRLYKITGYKRYLDFATYIVQSGGSKGYNVIEQAVENEDPEKIGGAYPKAYEMMALFEGVAEYYRVTGDERCRKAMVNLYRKIAEKEITLVGNGGGDQPYYPKIKGEAWDYTAVEQTNPKMDRMMETCSGVTWMKFCSQVLRLTGDPLAVDEMERYAYDGLIGAMKPGGDGFAYVNKLNGVKTNPQGWGGTYGGVTVTCCNLNGPMGLAYLPLVAVMQAHDGVAVNLYNRGSATFRTPKVRAATVAIDSEYPAVGTVGVKVSVKAPEKFTVRMRIPAWSKTTTLTVNGKAVAAAPGTYTEIARVWKDGDTVALELDMTTRLIPAPHGSNRDGDRFVALVRGPLVLARDENVDAAFDQPVAIAAENGVVKVSAVKPKLEKTRLQFRVPTADGGSFDVVDYATIDNWNGKRTCTWMPMA